MEQKINAKAVEHMAETARVLAEADSYLQKKGRELLAGCRKENGYLLDEKFFAQDPILQEYAVMEAFEILSGKRKDFTSLHVDQVLSLQKKRKRSLYQSSGIAAGNTTVRRGMSEKELCIRQRERCFH